MPTDVLDRELDAIAHRIAVYHSGQMKILKRLSLKFSEELEGQQLLARLGTYIVDLITLRNALGGNTPHLSQQDVAQIRASIDKVEALDERSETVQGIFNAVIAISNGWSQAGYTGLR